MKKKSNPTWDISVLCFLLGIILIICALAVQGITEKPKAAIIETKNFFQLADELCFEKRFIGPAVVVVNGKKITVLCR